MHTRLDINFDVNKFVQLMSNQVDTHWTATKRILKYLAGAKFKQSTSLIINGFFNDDWAICLDIRRSSSGVCIFLRANPVIWSTCK